MPFITGSYGEGMAFALVTGVASYAAALILHSVSWFVPIVTALLVSLTGVVIGAAFDPARPEILGVILRTAPVFIPPSIVAAVVCWTFARRVLRPA